MPISPKSLIRRALQYVRYDSPLARRMVVFAGLTATSILRLGGRVDKALRLEMFMHRNAFSRFADRIIETRVRSLLGADSPRLRTYVASLSPQRETARYFDDPERLLGSRIIVLKSCARKEKGVLLLDYSFVFPLFAKLFDITQITSRYHVVLEPSWSGLCDRDVLALSAFHRPIFVQTNEPRDISFLRRLDPSVIPIPIAANWWVDTRVFRPLTGIAPDADVVIIAAWARYKCHDQVFASLRALRRRGHALRTLLVGYPLDLTASDIRLMARQYSIEDQLELFESVGPEQVNQILNRARVNLIWSRREGSNRAIIEGLCAGVPGIMREGFNYGYHYPFINPQTGKFASASNLADVLLDMTLTRGCYTPRSWIEVNMTPHLATAAIDREISRHSEACGEPWTLGGLSVKITSLHSMGYWNPEDRQRFEEDYAFLRAARRNTLRIS
jgi:glycosyltransferase involved in cell wall biosynthesis